MKILMLYFLIYIFQTFTVNINKFSRKVKCDIPEYWHITHPAPSLFCWFSIKGCVFILPRDHGREKWVGCTFWYCVHMFSFTTCPLLNPNKKPLNIVIICRLNQWLITDNHDRYRHAPLFDLCSCRCSSFDCLWTVTLRFVPIKLL